MWLLECGGPSGLKQNPSQLLAGWTEHPTPREKRVVLEPLMIAEAGESDPILVRKLGYKSGFEAIFHPHGITQEMGVEKAVAP